MLTGRAGNRRWLFAFPLVFTLYGGLGAFVAWLIFGVGLGASNAAVFAAMGFAVAIGGVLPVAGGLEYQRRSRASGAVAVPGRGELEGCRGELRSAVLERRGSQLDQLTCEGTVLSRRVKDRLDVTGRDKPPPWLRGRGRSVAWSRVIGGWGRQPRRLVILGRPGYGKTVAALTLLRHVNATDRPGRPVAELFPLVEWFRWQAQHPRGDLADWLAYQLTMTYPGLHAVYANELVKARLVVPLLDGLDQVPESHRPVCMAAVDAYAMASVAAAREPSASPCPFVLTCRTHEYNDLAPDRVAADRQVELRELDPDQVVEAFEQQMSARPGWESLRQELIHGDRGMTELFDSPLVLGIALRAYRDPRELLRQGTDHVEEYLWDLFLTAEEPTFDGAAPEKIRACLEFLANSMRENYLQRLWLHEFYLFAPDPKRQRRFTRRNAAAVGVLVGLADWLLSLPAVGLAAGLGDGLAAAVVTALWLGKSGIPLMLAPFYDRGPEVLAPSVWVRVPWRSRVVNARKRFIGELLEWVPKDWAVDLLFTWIGRSIFLLGAGAGLAVLANFTSLDEVIIVAIALVALPLLGVFDIGSDVVTGEVPVRLAGAGRAAVSKATVRKGLCRGLYFLFIAVIGCGLIGALHGRLGAGLLVGLNIGLVLGVIGAFNGGLKAWYYNRRRCFDFAKQGMLPSPYYLRAFLDWCTAEERGWLRRADAYEFRYRRAMDYLFTEVPRHTAEKYRRQLATDPRVRAELALTLHQQAGRLQELGRTEQALKAIEESVELTRGLETANPVNRWKLAYALDTEAECLDELGCVEEALTAVGEAVEVYRELAAKERSFRPQLADALERQAVCLHELGRTEEALTAVGEAIEVYHELTGNFQRHPGLARSLIRKAARLRELEETGKARSSGADSQPTGLHELAMLLIFQAAWLYELAHNEEALAAVKEALAASSEAVQILSRLAATDPEFRNDLAGALNTQAASLSGVGRTDDALSASAEAVQILRQLATEDPKFWSALAEALEIQAPYLRKVGRTKDALGAAKEAKLLASAQAEARR